MGGVIARRLLPAAVGIPFILGWLSLAGQKAGLYGLETGVTITGLFSIAVFAVMLLLLLTK